MGGKKTTSDLTVDRWVKLYTCVRLPPVKRLNKDFNQKKKENQQGWETVKAKPASLERIV